MDIETQRNVARELEGLASGGPPNTRTSTVQVEIYTDERRTERECDLLRAHPWCAGLSARLPGPNTYRAETVDGRSFLLTRDATGTLRAFENACRHRGAELAGEALGEGRQIRCPFHGWCYDLEGYLSGRPHGDSFALGAKTAGALRLQPVQVTERDGLIWVGGEGASTEPPDGQVAAELRGFRLDTWSQYAARTLHPATNWKIAMESFLESYHIPVLHKRTAGPIYTAHAAAVKPFGRHLRLAVARKSIADALAPGETRPQRHFSVLYLLFPRTMLVFHADHAVLFRMTPDQRSPDRTEVRIDLYTPEKRRDENLESWRERNLKLLMDTLEEDFAMSEAVQRNARANPKACWVHGGLEEALQHFHAALAEALYETDGDQP